MGRKKILKMSYIVSCTLAWLLLASLPTALFAQTDNNMEIRHERYVTVPALGRTFGLGDIYDERNGQFRPISVYTDVIPETLIRKTEVHKNTMKSAAPLPTKFKDKFSLLGINERDTAVNVLAGLIEVDGSADVILNLNGQVGTNEIDTEAETGSVETETETGTEIEDTVPGIGILLIKYQTVVQDLPIFFKEIIPHYNSDILNHRGATHVVTRITWGFNIAVLFKCKPSGGISGSGSKRYESYLRREFQNIQDGKPAFENSNNINNISCSVSLSDGLSLPASANITQKDIQAILDRLPTLIRDIQTNGRKGVPLEYGLTPLSLLKRNLILDPEPNVPSQKIPGRYLENIPAIFDTILNSEQKLKALQEKLYSSILTVGYCIDPNIILKLDTFLQNFLVFKSSLIMELSDTLIGVRSSNVSGNIATATVPLSNFTSYYSGDEFEFSLHNVSNFISQFKGALEKIEFCRRLARNYGDIKYFGARDRNLNSINQNFQAEDKIASYILFIKSEFFTNDAENTEESLNTFLLKLYEPSHSMSVVDCDFEFKECVSVNGTVITGTFTIRNVDDTNYASGQENTTTDPGTDYPAEVEVLGKPTDYVLTTIKEEAFADLQREMEELKRVLNLTLQNMEIMQSVIDNFTRTAGNNTNNIDTLSLHVTLMDQETRKDIDYIRLEVIEGCCTAQSDFETLLSGMNDTILDNRKEIDLLRSQLAAANEIQKQQSKPEATTTTTETPVNKLQSKVHHHTTESPVTQVKSVNQTIADGDIQLDCGGMIQIPGLPYPGGSMNVEYKSTTTYENNERCLWTLDSSNGEGLRYNVRLHITLLSDGFADAQDVLSAIAWINWEYLTTYEIAKIKPVYKSKFKDFQYLSFTSNGDGVGSGFRAKIEVIGVQNKLSGYNWAYTSAVGTATYVPNRGNDRIAVVVNPPGKPVGQAYTLYVDYVEPRRSSYCNGNSTLYLFEIGEKGSSSLLASLCGISSPVTYTSRNPILAAYVTDSQPSGRGFKLSWR